jgi:hypothetical protein
MAAYLIIGCGLFFLTEALIGLFKPGVYKAVEPESRKDRPFILPIMGSILIIWDMACVGLNIPPVYIEDWALVVLGIPFIYKGVLTAFPPTDCRKLWRKLNPNQDCGKVSVSEGFLSAAFFLFGEQYGSDNDAANVK